LVLLCLLTPQQRTILARPRPVFRGWKADKLRTGFTPAALCFAEVELEPPTNKGRFARIRVWAVLAQQVGAHYAQASKHSVQRPEIWVTIRAKPGKFPFI